MKRIIKQIVAILIAVAFVGSIIFFIPQVPNNTPLSYNILIPSNLLNPNSSFYSGSSSFGNANVSSIGGFSQTSISSIISGTNATNLLQLTTYILNSGGFNYTEGSGRLVCIGSTQLKQRVCDNSTYSWTLFSGTGSNSLGIYGNSLNASLSEIKLNSLSGTPSFFLIYYNPAQTSGATNSSGIPHFPG